MDNVEIVCTYVTEPGFGFGIRQDTNERVFIPASVVRGSGIIPGEVAVATLVDNRTDNPRSPAWAAVRVDVRPRSGELLPNEIKMLEAVQHLRYATTEELAKELQMPERSAANLLDRLFISGHLAKAKVTHRLPAGQITVYLWAEQVDDFLLEDA